MIPFTPQRERNMGQASRGPAPVPCRRGQGGFSLMEVLVTLFVLSMGILAITKLQTTAQKANYEAVQRSTAAFLAHDILERMRANPTQLASYLTSGVGGGTISSEPTPICATAATTCTPGQLAAHDLWEWEQAIDGAAEVKSGAATGGLVSPTGCITGPAGGVAGNYVVAIAWRGREALSNPTSNTCGSASGNYGASNEYRRVLVVDTYLNN